MLGIIKVRAGLLGVLALLLVGAFSTAPASAVGGPFWHYRQVGGSDQGKLNAQAPEQVKGKGGEQKLKSKIGGMETEITAEAVEVAGTIYNNALQAQSALELKYINPTLSKPEGAKCEVKVGSNNTVKVYGAYEWKYKGNPEELALKPPQKQLQGNEWVFLPYERVQGESAEKTEQAFTAITIGGASCPTTLKVTQQPVRGSTIGEGQPGGLEEWSRTQKIKTPAGEFWQHDWNGTEFVPWKTGLFLGTQIANLVGSTEVTTASHEVAIFEG